MLKLLPLLLQTLTQVLFQFNKINKKTLVFGLTFLAITVTTLYFWQHNSKPGQSVWDVLDYYGFNEPQQKQSLEFMMKKAGIIKPTETFMTIFPKRKNPSKLFKDVLYFIELIQKHFTIRAGMHEQSTTWMTENIQDIGISLDKLKIINIIPPTISEPDLIVVFGAVMPTIKARLKYLDELHSKNALKVNFLVLLTEERKVSIGVDGTELELTEIAKKYNTTLDKLTENVLIQEAYTATTISNVVPTRKLIIIDNKAKTDYKTGKITAPTTWTTVQELCKWLKEYTDSIHSSVFIYSQPYLKYQESIVREVLRQEGLPIKSEVIGNNVVEINSTNVHRLIDALGTQILVQTPEVLSKAKIYTNDAQVKAKFVELYKEQPLTYNIVKHLLPIDNNQSKSNISNHKHK